MTNVFIVLPVFNEERALDPLLSRFIRLGQGRPWRLRFIAVNDGSTDGSMGVLESFRGRLEIEVVTHATNRGLGETLRDGLARAASEAAPGDVIVTMDADNTQPPESIPAMLEQLERGSELVIASRYRTGARVVGLSMFRRVMSYGARFVFQILVPVRNVRDYTCGFRAYRAGRLQSVLKQFGNRFAEEKGFASAVEILLKFAAQGAAIGEVPLVLRYDMKSSPSKMNVVSTVLRHLVLAWRNRFPARPKPPQQAPKQPACEADPARPPK